MNFIEKKRLEPQLKNDDNNKKERTFDLSLTDIVYILLTGFFLITVIYYIIRDIGVYFSLKEQSMMNTTLSQYISFDITYLFLQYAGIILFFCYLKYLSFLADQINRNMWGFFLKVYPAEYKILKEKLEGGFIQGIYIIIPISSLVFGYFLLYIYTGITSTYDILLALTIFLTLPVIIFYSLFIYRELRNLGLGKLYLLRKKLTTYVCATTFISFGALILMWWLGGLWFANMDYQKVVLLSENAIRYKGAIEAVISCLPDEFYSLGTLLTTKYFWGWVIVGSIFLGLVLVWILPLFIKRDWGRIIYLFLTFLTLSNLLIKFKPAFSNLPFMGILLFIINKLYSFFISKFFSKIICENCGERIPLENLHCPYCRAKNPKAAE